MPRVRARATARAQTMPIHLALQYGGREGLFAFFLLEFGSVEWKLEVNSG